MLLCKRTRGQHATDMHADFILQQTFIFSYRTYSGSCVPAQQAAHSAHLPVPREGGRGDDRLQVSVPCQHAVLRVAVSPRGRPMQSARARCVGPCCALCCVCVVGFGTVLAVLGSLHCISRRGRAAPLREAMAHNLKRKACSPGGSGYDT